MIGKTLKQLFGGQGQIDLIGAAKKGDIKAIEKAIKKGVNVDIVDEHDDTALMYAASAGHLSAVEALVSHGADVKRHCDQKKTALDWALAYRREDVARYLQSIEKS